MGLAKQMLSLVTKLQADSIALILMGLLECLMWLSEVQFYFFLLEILREVC